MWLYRELCSCALAVVMPDVDFVLVVFKHRDALIDRALLGPRCGAGAHPRSYAVQHETIQCIEHRQNISDHTCE